MTADLQIDGGRKVRVKLTKRISREEQDPTPACDIPGVMWEPHLHIPSGEKSGFVPLVTRRPMYFIDHGTSEYTHDAYGIHCYQEDRLTFLGPTNQTVTVTMFDARLNSETAGRQSSFKFQPNPKMELVIPAGVAHEFSNLENVYTVNRPRSLVVPETGSGFEYPDVVDWPLDERPLPTFPTGCVEVAPDEYETRVLAQKMEMKNPTSVETPAVMLVDDGNGKKVRVALRKKVS